MIKVTKEGAYFVFYREGREIYDCAAVDFSSRLELLRCKSWFNHHIEQQINLMAQGTV
ncbi:MAG: hypothetical protein Q9M19_01285 [Mariprofundaceae bacterium]|nr:hypothetical protein [Mariprofundaceae bacterium]